MLSYQGRVQHRPKVHWPCDTSSTTSERSTSDKPGARWCGSSGRASTIYGVWMVESSIACTPAVSRPEFLSNRWQLGGIGALSSMPRETPDRFVSRVALAGAPIVSQYKR